MNSTTALPKNAVIIVAAGEGRRLPGDRPKAYRLLAGKPMLCHCLEIFSHHPAIDRIMVAYQPGHERFLQEITTHFPNIRTIAGGATRQESVRLSLQALQSEAPDRVMIHDAARPFVSASLIDRLVAALDEGHKAALPTLPVQNTIKQVTGDIVHSTPPREQLHIAQTPQAFIYSDILKLHEDFAETPATDDAMLAEQAGIAVHCIAGERKNTKITYPEDLEMAEQQEAIRLPHVGMGYDVHKLIAHDPKTPNRHRMIRLCGIDIPSELKLEGHSDADVGLHALTDALLGALALGDIGEHFPPSEPRWRGADSSIFLLEAHKFLHERQAVLVNADITLIAEKPRLSPYRNQMRSRIAELLDISANRISVKATTHEKLGTLGRGEGIAAQAIVSVLVPGGV